MKNKISIIIPVYKVEPYIRRCLDSVIDQTYTNLEILLINDGSPDNCGEICDEYAAKDLRIRVFHKENGGLSSALNVGLKNFTGDFLGFVDSDDWIEPTMFEELCAAINGVDISICSYFKDTVSSSEKIQNKKQIGERIISTDNMLLLPLMRDDYMGFCGYVWNKLYCANIIRNSGLFFDENIKYAMDVLFYETLVSKQGCVGAYIDRPLYHYIQRADAITKSESYDIKTDILKVYKEVESLLHENHKYWARGFYCYHAGVICELARKKRDNEMFAKMQEEITAHYEDYKRTNEEYPQKLNNMKALMNAKLVNYCKYDIDGFEGQIGSKSIVCFGVYGQFSAWLMQNQNIIDKILALIDNDPVLRGSICKLERKKFRVVSFSGFLEYKFDNFVILINTNRHVDAILKQLDLSGELGGVDVYVAELKKYKNNETVKSVQTTLLQVLDEFIQICERNGLKYYLTGGTLLGAVRHKGFIPWDDDIDVEMPKHDFERFVNLPPQEFGEGYYLHWINTDKNCVETCARLKKRNTYKLEWARGYETANEQNHAVGVCIFKVCLNKYASPAVNWPSEYDQKWRGIWGMLQRVASKKFGLCVTSPKSVLSILPLSILLKIRECVKHICSEYDAGYFCEKLSGDVWGEGVPLEFEGKLYNAPNDWDYWLSKYFGNDYMQLPPHEKRFSHCPRKLSLNVSNDEWEDV